ncbi:hypothetical protein NHF46_09535 [Arthrobacter alpinus]|nr:hypothetical protein [Arthrobacter alpinus]
MAVQEKREVPDVAGMTYSEAYNARVSEDFFAKLVDDTGVEWTTGKPGDLCRAGQHAPQRGIRARAATGNGCLLIWPRAVTPTTNSWFVEKPRHNGVLPSDIGLQTTILRHRSAPTGLERRN